jgi:hydrogenase 3 maturation protease
MVEKKTSNSSWKKLLKESLQRAALRPDPRIAVLGIGNELNGDDAAGVWLVRRLQSLLPQSPSLLCLDCGQVPENAAGVLRRFQPALVLLLDAADFGGSPGEIRWIDPQDTSGFSASSHSLPFSVLSRYLIKEIHCEVGLLGIQPSSLEFDAGLSSQVRNTCAVLQKELVSLFSE